MRAMVRLLAALALVGIVGYGIWSWRRADESAVGFRTVPVERGDLHATISATGTIEPEEVVDVGAQVAGRISHLGADPRDSSKTIDYRSEVEEGTVLAQLDDMLYETQVDQARANLQRAKADLMQLEARQRQRERDWQRAENLRGKNISEAGLDAALADYEVAKSAVDVGKATIAQCEASLAQAETNLGYTTIRSPVKGVIVDRRVNVGQTVVASLNAPSLFLIAKDLHRLQVWASVNEADVGQIHPGQKVAFTVDAYPGEVFHGDVAQIRLNATMTQNVVTYTVVVATDNSNGKLLPYLTANLKFEIAERPDVLFVTNAALRWKPKPEQVAPEFREAVKDQLRPDQPGAPGPATRRNPAQPRDQGTLWVAAGRFVRPLAVKVGLREGVLTEVAGNGLQEATQVVIGEVQRADSNATTNPFAPQMFGKGSGT